MDCEDDCVSRLYMYQNYNSSNSEQQGCNHSGQDSHMNYCTIVSSCMNHNQVSSFRKEIFRKEHVTAVFREL
jgi:hypothetical protein